MIKNICDGLYGIGMIIACIGACTIKINLLFAIVAAPVGMGMAAIGLIGNDLLMELELQEEQYEEL